MRIARLGFTLLAASALLACTSLPAQQPASQLRLAVDSDHDGLGDVLEQALLMQFAPRFMIGERDCSGLPAEFTPGLSTPHVASEDGTIYGQVSPVKSSSGRTLTAEIHYYHLWRTDCGAHGHALDAEHVAVLVRASGPDLSTAKWKAVYWYAAAHENTVCDVSQIARASTLHAENRGAEIWISPGKHASYLNEALCQKGCGADRCENMVPLPQARIINLGEPGAPMNGSVFIASTAWPLESKMTSTNFPAAPIARLEQLPEADIEWFHSGRHPAQGVIAVSGSTEQALAASAQNTDAALSVAGDSSGDALSTAGDSTGNALQKSYHRTRHALGTSARHVGRALHVAPKKQDTPPQ
ncbi:MAG TPA: hypothetical protein VGM11_09835 [Acidobacteriaceae bacterium]